MYRVLQLQLVSLACFAVVGLNLARLQLWEGAGYQHQSERNHLRLVPSSAPRGRILDRTGLLLADNQPALHVVIVPQETHALDETLAQLSPLLQQPPQRLRAIYQAGKTMPFAPVIVAEDVPRETAMIIEERRHQLHGVFVQPHAKRVYPEGVAAAQVIGYVGDITAEELEAMEVYGYRSRDQMGKTGLERRYDTQLRGQDGGTMVEVDHRGRYVRLLGVRETQAGHDLGLTLSAWLQRTASQQLAGRPGACVMLDVRSGEVLALVSSPSYDPNVFLRHDPAPKRAVLQASHSPMLDRAAGATFTPGSIFKIVTAAAALEERRVTSGNSVDCHGALVLGTEALRCWKLDGHGPEDLRLAVAHSCNVYFGHVGLLVGPQALHDWAETFGYGRQTGIELAGERAGNVPGPSWWHSGRWYPGHTAHMAIGQGELLVTPLQAAVMTAAVANGGWLVHPRLLRRIGAQTVPAVPPRQLPVSSEALATIARGMEGAVMLHDGTAHRAQNQRVRIAAKTGTAQTHVAGHPHGWFVGYGPVEDPQIAVAVMLEHGGSGGDVPTEIARALFEAWSVTQQEAPQP